MNEENTSKKSFWIGVGSTVIFGFVIGFFVLLFMVLSDDQLSNSVVNANSGSVAGDTGVLEQESDIQVAEITDKDWIRGDKNAQISIIEFSDPECPFCKQFHSTMQQVVAEYDGKVNWVYRHFPLPSLHTKAQKEAEALECAGELGGNEGFWKYADRLYEITPSNDGLDPDKLPEIAQYVGLNKSKFEECLSSGKYAAKVRAHAEDAVNAGGRGTPHSVVVTQDGEKIPFSGALPFSQIKSLINQLL